MNERLPLAEGARVLVLGATGTIGRATVAALLARGHAVVCYVRPGAEAAGLPERVTLRRGTMTELGQEGIRGERFEALVSCMASRSGLPDDAWAVDHDANILALGAAQAAGVGHMVLLSAICVQKPMLAFQAAKLAFEARLIASGLRYSIVRPTAYFKSLSGQIARIQAGRPFLVFGDGRLTACKPISDRDLGDYLAGCLEEPRRWNEVLPIGGPGPAITPRDQAEWLFERLGRPTKVRQVPVGMMDATIAGLSLAGRIAPGLRAKAELARIGRYYATESMLVWNPATGVYDAEATPETGRDRLFDYYEEVISGRARVDLGEHAVF
ncbi:divinyl chlorophyllide a 8-vinyl-reductase [Roseovarius sp. MBR-51]